MGGVFFIMLSVNKTILILPGDGIGPEIVHEAQKIANILIVSLSFTALVSSIIFSGTVFRETAFRF